VIESLIRNDQHVSIPTADSHTLNATEESRSLPHLPSEGSSSDKFAWSMTLPSLSKVNTDSVLSWPAIQKALSSLRKYSFFDPAGKTYSTYLFSGNPVSSSISQDVKGATPFNFSAEREDIEPLVDQFFKEVHTKNPILSRATVQQACAKLYEEGPMWNTSTCLVLIICAIGSIAQSFEYREYLDTEDPVSHERQDRRSRLQMANSYFTVAEKRLGFALSKPEILSVHCLCLAG
jgi:hypothetical protein